MPARRTGAATLASLLVVLATALPATGADQASISHVDATADGLQLLVSVPVDAEVELDGVGVAVDGTTTTATAAPAGSTTAVRRTAVLAIDASNSMDGDRFAAAKAAALTFLDTVPDDVHVGVVSFADEVDEALAPTLDRGAARAVVTSLTLAARTRLYDGILSAVRMSGTEGQRTVLVLSDGADTSSTELSGVTSRVEDSGVLLDVVSLGQAGATEAVLRRLARAGQGRVVDTGPAALQRVFSQEADVLARQVVVTAPVPDSVTSREASITVTLPTSAGTLTAEAFAPVRRAAPETGAPPAPPAGGGFALAGPWLYVGLLALAIGVVVLLLLLAPRRRRRLTPAEVASVYTERLDRRTSVRSRRVEPEQALVQATGAAVKVLERNQPLAARIAHRLEGAGNPLKPAEWLLLHTAVFVGAGLVGLLLGRGSLVVGLLFLLLGALGPWLFLGWRRSRRRRLFDAQLPDTLQLMSGSLAAGLSLAQSVDTIVREGVEPVASEFRRVLVETRLGVDLEDALEGVAERFESKDFAWVVMAIKIQRQVGGNLAELLDTVAATMREREYMRRQVAALAAEGKLSAWVLGALPPLFLLYLLLTNRDYVIVMFTEPIGWAMLIGAGLLLSLGVFWMSRLIKVDV